MRFALHSLFTVGILLDTSASFYIPGYSIRTYDNDEAVPLWLNKIYSDTSQLQFAYSELPFVCPTSGTSHAGLASGKKKSLNLGEVLRGDRITVSDYDLVVGRDVECQHLCTKYLSRQEVLWAATLVRESYVAEWIVDNLPGATSFVTVDRKDKYYSAGFKLGSTDNDPIAGRLRALLHNHVTLVMRWRRAPGTAGGAGAKVIVGFEVYTKSVESGNPINNNGTCVHDSHQLNKPLELYIKPNNTALSQLYPDSSYLPESDIDDDGATLEVPYSYSVYWREDTRVEWANRWDMYFRSQEQSSALHWLAIVNALVILGLLSTCVLVIYGRAIRGDTKGQNLLEDGKRSFIRDTKRPASIRNARRNEKSSMGATLSLLSENDENLSDEGDGIEDISGFKLLHGDVFRPPPFASLLAPLVGSGTQLAFMMTGLLLLSCVGVLNPSWRGGFISVAVGLFVFAGIFAGYFSGRTYKTFGGTSWRRNTLLTALFFPGILFGSVFSLNIIVWAARSSTALPFTTLVALLFLWLLIQLPLVYIGSFTGYHRAEAFEHPTRTSATPRQIPGGNWYSRNAAAALLAGLPPFAVLFVELLIMCRSLWLDKSGYYYVYGYLAVVMLVAVLTIVQVSIIAIYVQLCSEDHRWWWQSFAIGASSGVWIFLFLVWYYLFKLRIASFLSTVLFFSYSAMACSMWSLSAGTVSFLAAYTFVRKIYSNVKTD